MTATAVNQELLQAMVGSLPADNLAPARTAAARKFAATGFPTVRQEDWKYTDLAIAADISNAWLSKPTAACDMSFASQGPLFDAVLDSIDAHWVIIRNGIIEPAQLEAIASAIGADTTLSRIAEEQAPELSTDDPLSAFNIALLRDGLRITAARAAAPDKPIGLLFLDSPSSAVTQTRVIIEANAASHLRLVECCLSVAPGRQFTNSVLETRLSSGARLDHVRIQRRDDAHVGTSRMSARLGRDSTLHHSNFDFGGALTRNDVAIEIAESGATVRLDGLYLASAEQHVDNHTCIVHGVGPSRSTEEYRGILAGRSRCVFNGKIIVATGADGTDSVQSNHNLLLSERAEIDTKPELEIYADDVKCAHGATVGQLDETALFYLRSRGLDNDQARQVLTRAFAAGMLDALAVVECRDHVAIVLDECLASLIGKNS